MSTTPEAVVLTEDGWWAKSHQDTGGWWWRRLDSETKHLSRYSRLPSIVEFYQPSWTIHDLARGAES